MLVSMLQSMYCDTLNVCIVRQYSHRNPGTEATEGTTRIEANFVKSCLQYEPGR